MTVIIYKTKRKLITSKTHVHTDLLTNWKSVPNRQNKILHRPLPSIENTKNKPRSRRTGLYSALSCTGCRFKITQAEWMYGCKNEKNTCDY